MKPMVVLNNNKLAQPLQKRADRNRAITSGKIVILLLLYVAYPPAIASPSMGIIAYQPTAERMQGELIVRGSTRLEPMIRAWFQEFSRLYPNIDTNIEASGSGSAPKALISGTANIGAMSRKIKQKEIDAFVKEKGYAPLELKVAMDALAVYVNRKNPIRKLTLSQVEAIYSLSLKCENKNGRNQKSIDDWKQLGWKKGGNIEIHNFHSTSGGYGLFKKRVLCKGDYKIGLLGEHKTSPEMTMAISNSVTAIGYASRSGNTGYGAKIVALSRSKSFPYYYPESQHIASHNYPLSRFLYLYIDKPPAEPLPQHINEFIKYIYSKNGQKTIKQKGAIPLLPRFIGKQLAKINDGRNR
jgi:phosphate transport system substrate-binding protein